MRLNKLVNSFLPLALGAALIGCKADGDFQGTEFAPNMYHSVPYEPLSQIDEGSGGEWVTTRDDEHGEFYSVNPYNPHGMSMRLPPVGTVKRRDLSYAGNVEVDPDTMDLMIYHYGPDDLELAATELKTPLPKNDQMLAEGQALYLRFCAHCHGGSGQGDGKVGQRYAGVPSYSSRALADITEGHIYHVITHGKGRMWPHASQIDPAERWKIVQYVQTLQKQ